MPTLSPARQAHNARTRTIHTLKRKLELSEDAYGHVKIALTGVASAADMDSYQHGQLIDFLESELTARTAPAHLDCSDAACLDLLGLSA